MKLKALAAGLAATAALGVGASAGVGATNSLAGTYQARINGALWTLTLNADGTFKAASRGTGVTGRIVIAPNKVTFTSRKGCPVSAGVGAYTYNIVKKSVSFAIIKDPCAALAKVLKGTRWQRVT